VAATAKYRSFQTSIKAGIAQLVEQLICNQQVIGSNPIVGSAHKILKINNLLQTLLLKSA
jgi:hypothetical protein